MEKGNNAWYELGRMFGMTFSDEELNKFFTENNIYITSQSKATSFKDGIFEKMVLMLDKKNLDTSYLKELYLDYVEEIDGLNKYYFFWGYDSEKSNLDKVMTVTEAAEKYGITEGTIRAAIKNGKLIEGNDYRKSGRITLITKKAMERIWGDK